MVLLSVVVVLSLLVVLLLLLQEMKVELKRRINEMMMCKCLTRFPISGLGEPYIYHDSGVDYKNRGFYLEELGQGCRII